MDPGAIRRLGVNVPDDSVTPAHASAVLFSMDSDIRASKFLFMGHRGMALVSAFYGLAWGIVLAWRQASKATLDSHPGKPGSVGFRRRIIGGDVFMKSVILLHHT